MCVYIYIYIYIVWCVMLSYIILHYGVLYGVISLSLSIYLSLSLYIYIYIYIHMLRSIHKLIICMSEGLTQADS